MTKPSAPRVPENPDPRQRTDRAGVGPDPDDPNPFGPDAPNVREDDSAGSQVVPEAPPPTPPAIPLDEGDFAPDEM